MTFDSAARTFTPPRDVLCVDGRFSSAVEGTRSADEVLDCSGRFLVPGLIDCHVHLTSSGAGNEDLAARGMPTAIRAFRTMRHAEATLRAGFTLVRDLGAPDQLNIHVAKAIADGLIEGPTIMAAGFGVTMTGGHGHTSIGREADGPDEVRKAVREQLRAGATAIKLFASGGVMTPGVDPRSPSYTEEELRAGTEEAHKAFRVVAAHAQATDGIKNAIRAGVDSIEHGIWLDEEAIGLMLEHGTYLVPTLAAPTQINAGGAEAGIPAFMLEKNVKVIEDHIASYGAAVKAGVKLAAGTDQGTPMNRPGENAREIVLMAQHGLSPANALLAATAWAAELLRVGHERGTMADGYIADAVILSKDPLTNIETIADPQTVYAVIKDGRVVYRNDGGTG
jgi:imidazolonepropionase-like amidohydrolase